MQHVGRTDVSIGTGLVELLLWMASATLVGCYLFVRAEAESYRRADLQSYASDQRTEPAEDVAARVQGPASADQSNWSESRKRAYQESLSQPTAAVIGKLRIAAAHLEVPIYGDTSDTHLNRGAGVIAGMALPGHGGNLGIAGHRDGYFRVLKDVQVGDVIEVFTRTARYEYRIGKISVVDQSDTRSLADTGEPIVTLVTCFPFYHLGHASRRYVVQGALQRSSRHDPPLIPSPIPDHTRSPP